MVLLTMQQLSGRVLSTNLIVFVLLCILLIHTTYNKWTTSFISGKIKDSLIEIKRNVSNVSNATVNCDKNDDDIYDLAFNDSYGFFADIDKISWRRQKRKANTLSYFKSKTTPEKGIENLPLWMLNNVDPMFTCPHIMRVGGMGDGGKWTCDPHRLSQHFDCLIYSIGSHGQFHFEYGLHKLFQRKCEIHVFDPNPKYARPSDMESKNITYHPWGIKSSYVPFIPRKDFVFRTIPDIVHELGHVGRRIDIFKIDCEGCEWTSYKDWILNKSNGIDVRQILIEVHPDMAPNKTNESSVVALFSDLFQAGFVPFSKEANTHPNAKPPLTLFEFSFIRLSPTFFVDTSVED